ncbi:unnamed protein product [Prunus armeniaca]|uniref:Protein kinase domain-containing protein n=1 Tax=Prunus armeniaca TaxID=36596 RepID=A0A6J5XI06_PRUAR|nr:unnamed protein product [Prunus armeniaca]
MFSATVLCFAQTNGSIAVGASLTATAEGNSSSSWLSPSDRTIVWYADWDNEAAVAPKGSTVNLTANSGLATLFFKIEIQKAYGDLHNPTDTLLPGQTLEEVGRFRLDNRRLTIRKDVPAASASRWEPCYLYVLREMVESTILQWERQSQQGQLYRATLNFDGIFAQYYHPRNFTGNVSWTLQWSEPDDICQRITEASGVGVCGYNSICTLKEDKRPTYWPISDYVQLYPFTAERCNESCFKDCLCAVAIFRKDNSTLQFPPMPNLDDKKTKKKSSNTLIRMESVILAASIFVSFMFSAAACLGFFFVFRKKRVRSVENILDSNLLSFSYQELQEATNGFTEELGRGAFGVVYKGTIQIGSGVQVAVKKLNCVIQDGEKEFKTELRVIASYLFADTKPSWTQRIEIACGVAKGLLYLHEECSTQVIHCDIKPQNILLDDYYTVRISDFGLAKLLMMNQSHTHTAIRGTKGYVAPEWFSNMPITAKVDVYSFGVVLLEIICCRRSIDVNNSREERAILTDWVYDCYCGGMLDAVLVLDNEVQALDDRMKPEKLVMIAIWCIQDDPSLRPTMRKVVQMLEGVVEVHVPPCPSPHTSRTG